MSSLIKVLQMVIITNTFTAVSNSIPDNVVVTEGTTETSTVSAPPTRATTFLPFILGGMRQDQNNIKTGSNYSTDILYLYM